MLLLLSACAYVQALGLAGKIDRSVCDLIVAVDGESCTCAAGVEWTAVDAGGATWASVDAAGAPGLQPVGTSQTHPIAAGTFEFDARWVYLDGTDATAEGPFDCEGGGYTRQNLACDCGGDTGSDTGSDTGA